MFAADFHTWRERHQQYLTTCLTQLNCLDPTLLKAMQYSTRGGKRLRPLLVYAAGTDLGAALDVLDAPACAVELIHAYSLIHDDLPCMDDDDLRRGQPTCHIAFGEATALLAGDALQALAFDILAKTPIEAEKCVHMLQHLARAIGASGMAGGQALDLAATHKHIDVDHVSQIHRAKTGALMTASILLGAIAAPKMTNQQLTTLAHFGEIIGLAFQIQDDILDVTGNTADLGKTIGSDSALQKPTYPVLMGLEAAQEKVHDLFMQAQHILQTLSSPMTSLKTLSENILQRRY